MSFDQKQYTKEYARLHYTKRLLESNQERTRLTQQLTELVSEVCDQIALSGELGASISLPGQKTILIVERTSHLGSNRFLLYKDESNPAHNGMIVNREPGTEFELHNDPKCRLKVASREAFLVVVNNLFTIITDFEVRAEVAVMSLREGIAKLKAMSE